MSEYSDRLKSRFVVIDGPDGAGKTTQLDMLQSYFESLDIQVERTFDPGGTEPGQRIREILLGTGGKSVNSMCETLLFMASRAQLADEVIRPALADGKLVLCDRFISATIAYQGAMGIDPGTITDLARHAVGDTWPDLTILLDISPGMAAERMGRDLDRVELRSGQYHAEVRRLFLELDSVYPAPVRHLDGEGSAQEVHDRIRRAMEDYFDNT